MAKRVSMKDIANKVGVSTALVSYVLNGLEKEKRVSRDVAEKIHKVAKELNYKPNRIARSLRKGSTHTIGLIVADISNPFFGQLARVIEDEAAELGFTVIIGSSDENCSKSVALIDSFLDRQVDGLIITPSEGCSKPIRNLAENNIPLVLMDRYFPSISTNHVILDNYAATYSATNHLIAKGNTKIRIIAYKSTLNHMQERIRGYREAMKANGLAKEVAIRKVRYHSVKSDIEKIIDDLFNEKKISALLFSTNNLSISGLYSIRNHRLKVPDELAIVGFDGHEVFDFFQPPVSFIKQPLEEMGIESVRMLINSISGKKEIVHKVLKPQLVVRQSSG